MSNIFSTARQYLENADIWNTLDEIEGFLTKNDITLFQDELINFRARYSRIKKKERHNLESPDNLQREWNKLTYALTELLMEVEREVKIEFRRNELQQAYQEASSLPDHQHASPRSPEEWNKVRNAVYNRSKKICLVHTLWPSKREGQEYDIYIYLVKHQSDSLDEVAYAEFFLGKYWDSQVFKVENKENKIGIYTAAYGPFLCLCKVTFRSGEEVFIDRYIDFEQGAFFTPNT